MDLTLISESFEENGQIPVRYTCDGRDVSPPLRWVNLPEGAKSLALIVDDPDAPDPEAPEKPWTHWLLYNIPTGVEGLAEGIANNDLPSGCRPGKNDWGRNSYGGPCPPRGMHRYRHQLYALDTVLLELKTPTKSELETAMAGHVMAKAELTGLYQRVGR